MFLRWITRCLPGLNIIGLVVLLLVLSCQSSDHESEQDSRHGWAQLMRLSWLSQFFVAYNLIINVEIIWFVLRTSLALRNSTRHVGDIISRRTPHSSDQGFARKAGESDMIHAIVIPNYKEDTEMLRATLATLARHPRARSQYEVYLAMEQKEAESEHKAAALIQEFQSFFCDIQATFHPENVPGEASGKGANENFAVRRIRAIHRGDPNVVVTIMDADTLLWEDYFTEICRIHHQHGHHDDDDDDDASHTIYTCPIIFDRNSRRTTFLVRCMDILWSWVCISSMYPGSCISVPVSIYSLPLALIELVDGWDTDHTAIGEDFHMMLKCFFKTRADLITRTIPIPASQCNIASAGEQKGWLCSVAGTCHARYRQGLRHMWGGALDFGYAVRQALRLDRRLWRWKTFILFQRLLEAYLLPTHFVIIQVVASGRGATSVPASSSSSSQLDQTMDWIRLVTQPLCTVSFLCTCLCFYYYHRWYTACLGFRKQDMATPDLQDTSRHPLAHHMVTRSEFAPRVWWHPSCVGEMVGIYLAGIAYSCLPLLHASLWHFWTDRLVYEAGMLMAMLGHWLSSGRPIYDTMQGTRTVPFISDIGSEAPKPVFVVGSIISMSLLTLSTALRQRQRQWLQHTSKGESKSCFAQICSSLPILFAAIGSLGLVLSSIYDSRHHLDFHNALSLVFMASHILSAISICAEYIRLGRACRWKDQTLLALTATRISLVLIGAILALAFRSTALSDETKNEAAILEWTVAYLFTGHILCFVGDLRPSHRPVLVEGYTAVPGAASLEEVVLRC
ncbi:Frag1/DRAM/Sfk1 family-domain-containing protein [Aspergillus pseudodeflectus]|uniref:Frag1/DRAM/Sfk1 family-domain-containing protein n=1 Tax=Aspergillus pseudodeflectus TaxID=176178 RepID=A0ABR4KML0_9EURO